MWKIHLMLNFFCRALLMNLLTVEYSFRSRTMVLYVVNHFDFVISRVVGRHLIQC